MFVWFLDFTHLSVYNPNVPHNPSSDLECICPNIETLVDLHQGEVTEAMILKL